MNPLALWSLAKTLGPWIGGAILLAGIGGLILDRNHLAALNATHQECLAAVDGNAGAKPLSPTCEPQIASAVESAHASTACDAGLAKGDAFAAQQACSTQVKTVIADRDAKAAEVANLNDQLNQASADQAAAVNRATARAKASIEGIDHAQAVLNAAPRGGDGLSVCDADCLRQLSGPSAGAGPGG